MHFDGRYEVADAGLLARLPERDRERLRSLGSRCVFDAGRHLFRQGDDGEVVYVILRGAVKVIRSEPAGKRTILTIRAAGDVVGDLAAVDGGRRSASVFTLTPLVCRAVAGGAFRQFVDRPTVATAFARYMAARLRESDVQRTELAVLPVRQRLARALLRLYQATAHAPRVPALELSQQDLAELVGASRNAVVLALGVLRAEGVIDTQPRRVTVRDPAELVRIAEAVEIYQD